MSTHTDLIFRRRITVTNDRHEGIREVFRVGAYAGGARGLRVDDISMLASPSSYLRYMADGLTQAEALDEIFLDGYELGRWLR